MSQPVDREDPHPHPGESMNVREVHDVIVRELPEPRELYKKVPWYLRHFYAILIIGTLIYLAALAGKFNWKDFDTPLERAKIFESSP